MYGTLPKRVEDAVMGKQVLRSRSDAELIAKLGLVEQELDETMLWLELLVESGVVKQRRLADL